MPAYLLFPPIAFVIYLVLVGIVAGFGHVLAGPEKEASALKTSTYASGEAAPRAGAATGYSPFFVIALFFAVVHLGVLVLASGGAATQTMALFLAGLVLVLIILILG